MPLPIKFRIVGDTQAALTWIPAFQWKSTTILIKILNDKCCHVVLLSTSATACYRIHRIIINRFYYDPKWSQQNNDSIGRRMVNVCPNESMDYDCVLNYLSTAAVFDSVYMICVSVYKYIFIVCSVFTVQHCIHYAITIKHLFCLVRCCFAFTARFQWRTTRS